MKAISLSFLLEGICRGVQELKITGLSLDSRTTKPGDLFFACVGNKLDGRQFISAAIKNGACAVLAEKNAENILQKFSVPVIEIENLSSFIGSIAARFYGYPSKKLPVIGITGTNGKTSCCHWIATLLQQANLPCGVLGTLGNGMWGHLMASSLTTLDAISLQATLAKFLQQGARAVAMEVSSHSLDQGRVNGIDFTTAVFTNLTRDHLDYHHDMESYGRAKQRLFEFDSLRQAIINVDDPFGQHLIEYIHTHHPLKNVYAFGLQPRTALKIPYIYADAIRLDLHGIRANIHSPWGEGLLQSALIGEFNLSNLLAVLTVLCSLNMPLSEVLAAINQLRSVAGRMQTFGGGQQPAVVVDYAHTPDALANVLRALRMHTKGRLWCLFGCGGERDAGKRPLMAAVCERYADKIIVTDDNPRSEDPEKIVAEILTGFQHREKISVQHGRPEAVQKIIASAEAGDCVLIAGKGAETYQHIGAKKIPYSDIEWVTTCLGRLKY